MALGMSREDAEVSAEVLHDADLTGIDTHGIALLGPHAHHAVGIQNGEVDVRATITVLRDSPVAAAWDSGNGYGPLIAYRAMEAAIAKAEQSGIGMVTVRNARHFGANAYRGDGRGTSDDGDGVLEYTGCCIPAERDRQGCRNKSVRIRGPGRQRPSARARHRHDRRQRISDIGSHGSRRADSGGLGDR